MAHVAGLQGCRVAGLHVAMFALFALFMVHFGACPWCIFGVDHVALFLLVGLVVLNLHSSLVVLGFVVVVLLFPWKLCNVALP